MSKPTIYQCFFLPFVDISRNNFCRPVPKSGPFCLLNKGFLWETNAEKCKNDSSNKTFMGTFRGDKVVRKMTVLYQF